MIEHFFLWEYALSSVIGVIPVRFGATRFPGKPLAPILNKPMLQWVLEGVSQSQLLKDMLESCRFDELSRIKDKISVKNCFMIRS